MMTNPRYQVGGIRVTAQGRRFMAMDGKPKATLSPIRPNAGIIADYSKRLGRLVDEMAASVSDDLKAAYRRKESEIVQDASAANTIKAAMEKLSKRWLSRFDDLADELARKVVGRSAKAVEDSLKRSMRKAGFTVKFRPTKAQQNVLQASVAENVALIKSIPQQYLTGVEGTVMRSINRGFDLGKMAEDLQKQYGVTKRRAYHIANDQGRKATATFARTRSVELGITKGIWKHSAGGKTARQSHKAFDGKEFDLREGHDFGDDFGPVLPGEAINCRCYYTPVIDL